MTDQKLNDSQSSSETATRQSPFLLAGIVLWCLCLAGILFGWYQWRLSYLARTQQESQLSAADEDDGKPRTTIKIVQGEDGSLEARAVTPQEEEKPWDPNGIEDFSFTDTEGQTVTKKDLIGKPCLISFIFTLCRGPCPNVTREMREIQDRMKDYDFNLVSLTVDPERDTLEVLKDYAKASGADLSRWKFLTGKQSEIYGLIHRSFLLPVEEDSERDRKPGFEIIHSTNIMLVDQSGRVIAKFNAQKGEEMAKLRKELKLIAPRKSGRSSDNNE